MNLKNIFLACLLVVISGPLCAMEESNEVDREESEESEESKDTHNNDVQRDYIQEIMNARSEGHLKFDSRPGFSYPVNFGLNNVNDNITISIFKGFEQEKRQKALLTAMHFLYLSLSNEEFNVTLLEKVMLGDYSLRAIVPFNMSNDEQNQFTQSTIRINDEYSKEVLITQRLYGSNKTGFILDVKSNVLPGLNEQEQEKYREALHSLAGTILSPMVNAETETGKRKVFLDSFKHVIEDISHVIHPHQGTKSKGNVRSRFNFRNILNTTFGSGIGLAAGFGLTKVLHAYVQNYNPKFAVPIFGLSSILGGLGGYYLPKIFKR